MRPLREEDYSWILSVHCQHYFQVEGFDPSFRNAVEQALDGFRRSPVNPATRGFMLESDGRPVGSLLCLQEAPEMARLKLFFVAAELRGHGHGERLLNQVIDHCRRSHCRAIRVSTYSAHGAACALYRKTGFLLEAEKPVVAFGRPLCEQHWRLELPLER